MSAFGEMVLAGTFSAWYWAFNKPKDVPVFALSQSIFRTVRFVFNVLIVVIYLLSLVMCNYSD